MLVLEFKSNVCTVIQYFWLMKETFCVLSGFVETLRSLKLEKNMMVWPIIWLSLATVRYFKLKCKILFLFKDNTLPFGLCCKIFKGWRWTGSVWRHLFKKLKPPLTSRWLQVWDWKLQDKFGKSHHANEQGSFQKLLKVWQTDSGTKEDEPYLSKDRGDLSINKDNNKNKRLKHTQCV